MIIFVSNNFNHIKKLMSIPNIKNNLLITSSFENAFLWSKFKKIELIIFDVNINLNLLQKQNIAYINYFDFLNKIKNLSLQNENKKIENKEISQEKKEIQFPSKSNKSNYEKLSCVKTKDNIQENTTPIPVNKLSLKCRNIITITSVKGGVGKTNMIKFLMDNFDCKSEKLILDLNFYDGGSDLSFILDLPKVPNISTYINDDSSILNDCTIPIENNFILQCPPKIKQIKALNSAHICKMFNEFKGNHILIDMPYLQSNLFDYILKNSSLIYIISTGSVSELSRIKERFKEVYNKIHVLIVNPKNSLSKKFFDELNIKHTLINNFPNEVINVVYKDINNNNY